MKIDANKKMMLFRYSNYRRTKFIEEHHKKIVECGYTWMMKAGKRSDDKKIEKVLNNGGFMLLKSPVKEGDNYYLAIFDKFLNEMPDDNTYPEYYEEFITDMYDVLSYQWFRVTDVFEVAKDEIRKIILSSNQKSVLDVLGTTRTAVMFVENEEDVTITSMI